MKKLPLLFAAALSVGTARAQLCPPCPPLDDQSCYQTPRKNTLRPPIPLTLVDRFGSITATATDIHRLCTPSDKNGDCPDTPQDPGGCAAHPGHFLGLTLKQVVENVAPVTGLRIGYQFGVLVGDLGKAGFMLTPAGKSLTPPAPPPPPGFRNYNCHRVENTSGDRNAAVTIVDQFTPNGFHFTLDEAGPWTLCVPADVNGSDPTAPSDPSAFLCNLVNDNIEELPFNQKTVFTRSALTGPFTLTITRYDDLCMPAVIQ